MLLFARTALVALTALTALTALSLTPPRGAEAGTLGCALTQEDWSRITVALSQRNYYKVINDGGDCAAATPSSLTTRYAGCAQTLTSVVQQLGQTCVTTLAAVLYSGGRTQQQVLNIASGYCGGTLSDFISEGLCYPLGVQGCPDPIKIADFLPFGQCFIPVLNMTTAQASTYFSTQKDQACIATNKACQHIAQWSTCPITLNETFNGIDQQGTWSCVKLFKSVLNRCDWTFDYLYDGDWGGYCRQPSPLQQYFLVIVLVPTIVPVFLLFLAWGVLKCWRAQFISHEELLSQSMLAMPPPLVPQPGMSPQMSTQAKTYMHPEMHAAIAKASKYKGVEFDPVQNTYMFQGKAYEDEKAAARAAYMSIAAQQFAMMAPQMQQMQQSAMRSPQIGSPISTATGSGSPQMPGGGMGMGWGYSPPAYAGGGMAPGMSGMSGMGGSARGGDAWGGGVPDARVAPAGSVSEPPRAPELSPEQLKEMRKRQLVEFYHFWDDSKPDIPGHVEHLFEIHEFEHIVRAILTKFGVVPPGWEEALDGKKKKQSP